MILMVAFWSVAATEGSRRWVLRLRLGQAEGKDVMKPKRTLARNTVDHDLALVRAFRINGTSGFVVGQDLLRGAADLRTLQRSLRKPGRFREVQAVRNEGGRM
jgi:hypothetical protein